MALDRLQILLSRTLSAMSLTASKSPWLDTAKPASMTSTFIFSSNLAILNFSSLVIEAPGLCSPSRSVVSNITNLSLIPMVSSAFLSIELDVNNYIVERNSNFILPIFVNCI